MTKMRVVRGIMEFSFLRTRRKLRGVNGAVLAVECETIPDSGIPSTGLSCRERPRR